MTEHHIHIHLASQGTQAAQQVVAEQQAAQTQAAAPDSGVQFANARTQATAILVGVLIGRQKGELSQETAVSVADDILDAIEQEAEVCEVVLDATRLLSVAHVAAGYLMHGSGQYKKTTIAERAVAVLSLI